MPVTGGILGSWAILNASKLQDAHLFIKGSGLPPSQGRAAGEAKEKTAASFQGTLGFFAITRRVVQKSHPLPEPPASQFLSSSFCGPKLGSLGGP